MKDIKEIFFLFSVNQKFFTDTAIELNKLNKNLTFSGLAYSKHKYFNKFNYKKIFYINDIINDVEKNFNKNININYIENYFDINFSELIHLDRHIIRKNKNYQKKSALNLVRFIVNYLESAKPSLVIAEGVDDLVSFVACKYCNLNKINFFSIQNSRLGNGLFLSDRIDTGVTKVIDDFNFFYNKLKNKSDFSIKEYDDFIKEYISNKKKVYYLDKFLNFKNLRLRDINIFFNYLREYFHDPNGFHYKNHPISLPFLRIFRQFKNFYYNFFLNKIKTKDLKNLDYFYYGLQVFPEAATLVLGRETPDQLNIIKIISKALPYGKSLIVKEHPHAIGRRSLFFYNKINEIHNVYLIEHNENNYDILKKSKGLITISSSLSLEAILMKKPVYIYGDYYLNIDKNVTKINDFNTLKKILNKKEKSYNLKSRKSLLYSILNNSVYMRNYLNSRNYKHETIIDFAKIITQKYKLK